MKIEVDEIEKNIVARALQALYHYNEYKDEVDEFEDYVSEQEIIKKLIKRIHEIEVSDYEASLKQ